jgi:ABC transport system ATP-binding/permease protein
MWKLTIEDDEGKRIPLPLFRDEYTIGRSEENTIRLTERNISRKHACLQRRDAEWVLLDVQSYNGLYINGVRVSEEALISHGDVIQLGDYRIEVLDESMVENTPTSIEEISGATTRPDRLVVVAGPNPGQEFIFDETTMMIGRAAEVSVSIPHVSVSRVHAEIHALGNARYEIIDKGSANGVRVNGSLLGRALIEAGDYIELGEVRLKFVGAGQVFWPGAEATRLASGPSEHETMRPPPAAFSSPSDSEPGGFVRSNTAKNIAMGGVGALVAIASMLVWQRLHGPPASTAAPISGSAAASADPSRAVLDEAMKLAAAGKLDLAHARLASGVPAGSPVRETPDVRDIENKWADAALGRADQEPDPAARRALLSAVAQSTSVDQPRRRVAVDKVRELDNRGTEISALPQATRAVAQNTEPPAPAPGPAAPVAPRVTRGAVLAADPWATPAPANNTAARAAAAAEPEYPPPIVPKVSPADLAAQGRDGEVKARAQLEPKVWGGRASPEEIRLLRAICKHMGDRACSDRASALLNAEPK